MSDRTDQLIAALQAATTRMMEHRRVLRRASVLLRVYPQGLVFSCQVTAQTNADLEAGGHEEVAWEKLTELDAEKAVAIVDRVCEKAHVHLGAAGSA